MDAGDTPLAAGDQAWLYEPAVADEGEPWVHGEHPWRVGSQVYVAFFGGVVAVTWIAYLNAKRLGLSPRTRWQMLAAGAVGLVAVAAIAVAMDIRIGEPGGESRNIRLAGRGVALVLYFLFARMQRTKDRLFQMQSGDYASLWGAGIGAAIGGGILQAVVVLGALWLL